MLKRKTSGHNSTNNILNKMQISQKSPTVELLKNFEIFVKILNICHFTDVIFEFL